ncbi:MAG: phage major capsid protein, partial [Clostridia bacterium]|nr:phage major capsid protein [Clostridia bacterium]
KVIVLRIPKDSHKPFFPKIQYLKLRLLCSQVKLCVIGSLVFAKLGIICIFLHLLIYSVRHNDVGIMLLQHREYMIPKALGILGEQAAGIYKNLKIPYYDESTTTITVAYANEFEELASNVGAFTTIELTGYLAGTLSLISRSLINNSQFDVVGFVVDRMAYDIHRFIEGELLNGTDGKVTGLSDLTNTMTAASGTEITADEVIKLKDNIKDVFQGNAIWIMSPATRTALRLLKDEVGRYLLQDDITSPFGTTLLGKPIYVTDNMSDMAAGNTAIYYGDMSGLTTKFSEDMNIEVLREKYATQHAIGVVGWLEFDSKVNDAQKITALKMATASA